MKINQLITTKQQFKNMAKVISMTWLITAFNITISLLKYSSLGIRLFFV